MIWVPHWQRKCCMIANSTIHQNNTRDGLLSEHASIDKTEPKRLRIRTQRSRLYWQQSHVSYLSGHTNTFLVVGT
jgi:hypothetical protein